MAQSLVGAIQRLQQIAAGIAGVKAAPDYPPEAMPQFPFVISYPESGWSEDKDAGWGQDVHVIVTEAHYSRVLLPTAVQAALSFWEAFTQALAQDPTLNGTCETVIPGPDGITYRFGRLTYAGEEHVGWQIRVKIVITRAWQ